MMGSFLSSATSSSTWANQYAQMQQSAYTPGQAIPTVDPIFYLGGTVIPTPNEPYKPEVKPQRRKTMLENVKGYVEKHKDILFTLGLVILVDHFLFKGALRSKIQGTLEGVLKKAENMIQKQGE